MVDAGPKTQARSRWPVVSGLAQRGDGKVRVVAMVVVLAFTACAGGLPRAEPMTDQPAMLGVMAERRLLDAYPSFLREVADRHVHWYTGVPMAIGRRRAHRLASVERIRPDIAAMLAEPYRAGPTRVGLRLLTDPGRVRPATFFDRMYGSCRSGTVQAWLVPVAWLPKHRGGTIWVTRINGIADRLAAISRELDAMPIAVLRHLLPAAGGHACRAIAGSSQPSPHGWGIAVDIAVASARYWRWQRPRQRLRIARPHHLPPQVLAAFERHGFIWGGKWHHYDTMHFEYRPELLAPTVPLEPAQHDPR